MAEKVHFLPADLRIHRSQAIDLNVEFMNWFAREAYEHFKIDVTPISGLSEKEAIENWIREYANSIVEKLCSDPHGIYYLIELKGAIIGMGAFRQIREKTGEVKRMYIRPAYRGKGYGKALLQQLLKKAKEFGYHSVYLDTGPFMTAAHRVYRSLGFVDCNEYPESEAQILPPQLRSQWRYLETTLEETSAR